MRIGTFKLAAFCRFVSISLVFLLVSYVANSQIRITGRVTNITTGEAVQGGTVSIKGTTMATSTSQEGTYVLSVNLKPGVHTLLFSGIGTKPIEKKINIGTDAAYTIDVQVDDDVLGMDEVVVTGTGVAVQKRQLGNSVSVVNGKDLLQGASSSVSQALQGKIAGALVNQNSGNPAGGFTINLRGVSTISGSSEPLYIIDGVIVSNDSRELIDLGGYTQNRLTDLNPNDIERIEVIKGAAAAAIYGSRANNGVVQIFTKKGVEGKPQFNFSTQVRSSSRRKKLEPNMYPFRYTNFTATDTTRVPVERYDLQDMIFRNAIGTENNFSVSGGGSGTRYFASFSNFYNQGIVKATDYSRNGVRLNLQQKLSNIVTLAINTAYSYSTSSEIPNGGINSAYGVLTGFIFANNYVNPAKNPVTGVYPSLNATAIVQRTNPLEAIDRFKFRQKTSRLITSATITVKPVAGLNIEYISGIDNYTQIATGYIPPVNTTPSNNGGFSRSADAKVMQLNNDLNISYQKEIAKELQSTTTLGGTIQYEQLNSFAATALNLGPYGETINSGTITPSEFRSERANMGSFLQQTFGYKGRYFITGAVRIDASSVYGAQNRSQLYSKLSGAYIVSNEEFWSDGLKDAISSLKLRAAYGQSGNQTAIGPYSRFLNYDPIVYSGQIGYVSSTQLGNPGITPERQNELEVGFDMGLVRDRVSIEFSYYKKSVKDLILGRTLAPSTGYLTRFVNVGTLENTGIDLLVRAAIINQNHLKWRSTVSYMRNKGVINGVEGNGILPFPGGFGQVAAVNGKPLGAFYSTFFARKEDGSLLLTPTGFPQRERGTQGKDGNYTIARDANGQPSGAILSKVIGDPNPEHILSFINEVDFKNFTFRMQWDGMYGFDVFNFTKRVGDRDFYGGLKGYEAEIRGEVPKGTSAALFSIFENWIEDGSYTKLREVSLSYNLLLKNRKSLRFSLVGRNLLSIDNYSGWDPETNAAGQDNAVRAFDFVEVPIPRTISFGINFNF